MKFTALDLEGAFLIEQERHQDARGFFARTFCAKEFAEQGLCDSFVQHNLSFNEHEHTLRGMHWQAAPHGETKVVSCVQGAITDVLVDVRSSSPTFGEWQSFELTPKNGRALYIPQGFAHGFITHASNTLVHYLMSAVFTPGFARAFHHADPEVGIEWPAPAAVISDKDDASPSLQDALKGEGS